MGRLLLIGVLLIVYGSLYPWEFRGTPGPLNIPTHWRALLSGYTVRDAAVNLALYVPVGLAGYLALPRAAGVIARISLVVSGACLLSLCIEAAQMFVPGRVAAPLDILTNTMGAAAGGACGALRRHPLSPHSRSIAFRDFTALLLVPCWIAAVAFPFVSEIRGYVLSQKVAEFVHGSLWDPLPLMGGLLTWYAAGHILAALQIWRPWLWLGLGSLVIPLQIAISGRNPSPAELTGALFGTALFAATGPKTRAAAALAVFVLLVVGLYPFHFGAQRVLFTWLPFGGFLQLNWQNGASILATKGFQYGATLWLLLRGGLSLPASAALVAGLLSAVEFLQLYLPGRTPEITDPLIALSLALVFSETERAVARGHRSG